MHEVNGMSVPHNPNKVDVDPDHLEKFADRLTHSTQAVSDQLRRVSNAVGQLGEHWRDREYTTFVEQFRAAQIDLQRFVKSTEAVTPQLRSDVERLRKYLGISVPPAP